METNSSSILKAESFEIQNPEVFVETVSSDVKILDSPDGWCHVEIHGDSDSASRISGSVQITAVGEKVSVRIDRKSKGFRELFRGGSGDLSVVIKLSKTSALKVKTVSADIEVNQSLARIEAGSVSGDIAIIQNPLGICALKTVSGDITAHTFSACQYSLKSVSGDISIHVARGLEVDVDGKSVSGDLESEIPLSGGHDSSSGNSELVTITTSTVSGDFILARN